MTRHHSVVRPVLAAASAAVLASACGGPSEVAAPDPATVPPGATSPADATSPTDGASPTAAAPDPGGNLAALDFVAPDLTGGQVRGADHAGEDVVLWMWAPW